ncbi:hypothetical protein Leryth_025536 [Lithospermum erythrorhizon]|nr:hypothetical protein Leryth_025536 [Lithospermum erythrorhizon]
MSIPNITTDQSTLLQFKSKIIDPHYFLKNWLANKSVCEYTGVACSTVHNRVITLNISNMGLIGNIPPGLGNLSFLKSLTLRLNNFTGILPQDFVHLRRLRLLDVGFNQFIGNLPIWLFSMSKIEYLSLSYNNFTGSMSPLISNLTSLKAFTIGNNSLEGRIPQEFVNLENLILLDLQSNKFTGPMPNICNISTLESMAFADNQLNGVLPTDLCHCFPRLKNLYLGANQFVGEIPSSLHECSSLQYLSLEFNNFNGSIPRGIGNLTMLKSLRLQVNNFSVELFFHIQLFKLEQFQLAKVDNLHRSVGGHASNELSIITSLTHCRNLQHVLLYGNHLNGSVPKSIGNFSSKLETFHISNSYMSGIIPDEIGNLTSLVTLFFGKNMFSGHIPKTINNLKLLQLVSIRENQISGQIPVSLCEMQSLSYLLINSNRISGEIPACVGTMKSLRQLNLSDNLLGSSIPLSFWSLRDLLVLSISMNNFSGSLPLEVGKLDGLALMDLSSNRFSGNVPTTLGDLISLQGLFLGNNRFEGSIPESLGNMFGLEVLDLSNNDLNGEIPMSLQNLSYLKIFNVSFNKLVGEIPSEGPFLRFEANYFTSNEALCVVLLKCKRPKQHPAEENIVLPLRRISYQELFQATSSFNSSNLLGMGSFGNLTKVITSCSNPDFKALVLEYMPNGSLEKWLHSDGYFIDMLQSLDIMVDVADALEYLHHGFPTPIVHCDLKPSNILLDENMSAHVSDFGLTKFMNEESFIHTRTLATWGYIAPDEQAFKKEVQCMSSIMELALNCCVESPQDRMNMKDVHISLQKIKLQFQKSTGSGGMITGEA